MKRDQPLATVLDSHPGPRPATEAAPQGAAQLVHRLGTGLALAESR